MFQSGLMSEVFNSHMEGTNPDRMRKANDAFKAEEIRIRIENERIAAEKKAEHSARIKMGLAIRKAHDERGLPPMSRHERKTALDFAMVTNEIHKAADEARKNIRSISLENIRAEIARENAGWDIRFPRQAKPFQPFFK